MKGKKIDLRKKKRKKNRRKKNKEKKIKILIYYDYSWVLYNLNNLVSF